MFKYFVKIPVADLDTTALYGKVLLEAFDILSSSNIFPIF